MVRTLESSSNRLKMVFESIGAYSYCGGSSSSNNSSGSPKRVTCEDVEDGSPTIEMMELGVRRRRNVLVLMSDTGGGHRASAEAIRDAFKIEFGDQYRVQFLIFSYYSRIIIFVILVNFYSALTFHG